MFSDPIWTFFVGLALLMLFGWYCFSDEERTKRIVGSILSVLLIGFCVAIVVPPFDVKDPHDPSGRKILTAGKIALGLDLRGGTSFLIRLIPGNDPDGKPRTLSQKALEQAMEAIRKRVDRFGVSEPIITPEGKERILVQIPGINEERIADAKEQLQKVAKLEFRMVSPQSEEILAGRAPWDSNYIEVVEKNTKRGPDGTDVPAPDTKLLVRKAPDLTGDHVNSASAAFGPQGEEVDMGFDREGTQKFGELTAQNVGQRFAILLDGVVITAPQIKDAITGGRASITGTYTPKQAQDLASALENPLQTPVQIEEQRSASATLGESAIRSGITAGLGGLALVLLFVVVYYRFAGLVAVVGLVVNIVVLFGVMSMFNFTLTLPGIAGVILTIGLAVDANVLIYERLREEMAAGKPLAVALSAAYDKAFTVIFDANATTLITAAILFWKASGPVKGFAVTLTVGVVASVFSAMIVTRVVFSWALQANLLRSIKMLHIIPTGKNFDFLGRRFLWIGLSVAVIVGTMTVFTLRGGKNFGIDFKGGDLVMLSSPHHVDQAAVRNVVDELKLGETVVQTETVPGQTVEYTSIRCPTDAGPKVAAAVLQQLPQAQFEVVKQDKVGTIVGGELANSSFWAFGLGVVGILIFVTIRFELAFAVGAIVALLHDVLITVGIFAICGKELSLVMVGAILTIAGYSINDTIVVYDRIREGLASGRRGSVQEIMNASINETLSRTLLTSGCTFLSVAALFFFGGPVLHDFAFTMLVGIIVGTYSSIFIASPIVLWWSGHKGQRLRTEVVTAEDRRTAIPTT